jgi:hypothetical protein
MNYRVKLSDGTTFLVDRVGWDKIVSAFNSGSPGPRFIQGLQTIELHGGQGATLHLNVDHIVTLAPE